MRLAVTGLGSFIGLRAIEALLETNPDQVIVGLDLQLPASLEGRIVFRPVDLTGPTADGRIAEILREQRCDAVLHTAFFGTPQSDVEYAHELEVVGSLHLLNAIGATGIEKLVVMSSAEVYGAHPDNPNFLTEQHALRGNPDSHAVSDRIEVERLVRLFARRHPLVRAATLRPVAVVGPSIRNRFTRYFGARTVTTLLGYDPLMQFLHEDDLVDAVLLALARDLSGPFNLAGAGVLPLSTLLRLAGKRNWPCPHPLLYSLRYLDSVARTSDPPQAFYDYLRFLWVVDASRAARELGFAPLYTSKEAWMSFVVSRKLEVYG